MGTSEMFPAAALSSERVASSSESCALPLWHSALHSGEGGPVRGPDICLQTLTHVGKAPTVTFPLLQRLVVL